MFGLPVEGAILQTGIDAIVEAPPWPMQLVLVTVAALSALVAYRLAAPGGQWARRIRSRLLLGIPWGTVLTVLFLLGMYLVVQGAYDGDIFDPRNPVTYAFTAWSYDYPLGIVTAAFSHNSFGHFLGNTIALVVFGSIAEYAYGHFPTGTGKQVDYGGASSPYLRPLAFFGAILLVGLATAAFTPGSVIGFSGVVYVLIGFALVMRPLAAVGGLLVTTVLHRLYGAFTSPVTTHQPSTGFSGVWFADIAILGHLLGFLLGVVLAVALWRRRGNRPPVWQLWAAGVTIGLVQNLWIVYFPLGNGRFALFRAVGVAFIFVLAALAVAAAVRSSRPLVPWPGKISAKLTDEMPTRGQVAAGMIVISLLGLTVAGAATNLRTVDSTELPNDPVEVRDYRVTYSENVTNQLYSVIDVPGLNLENELEASGVIVYSEQRNVWQVAASTSRLASNGYVRVTVGGVGWRETVGVTRTAWKVVGGSETYRVRLHPPDGEPRLAVTSGPARADVTIANRSIAIEAAEGEFDIAVRYENETKVVEPMPESGENATVAGIRFERDGKNLYANYDGTRVRVANKKVPPARRN